MLKRPLRCVLVLSALTLVSSACHEPDPLVPACTTDAQCARDERCDVSEGTCHSASGVSSHVNPPHPDAAVQDAGESVVDAGTETPGLEVSFQGAEAIDVEVDATGRVHVAVATSNSIQHGSCASDCTTPEAFGLQTIETTPLVPHSLRLEVNAAGEPRVAWFQVDASSGEGSFHYGECQGTCAAADWQFTTIASQVTPPSDFPDYLYAAADGRMLLAYAAWAVPDSGTFVANCTADCAQSGSWTTERALSWRAEDFGVRMTAAGDILVAAVLSNDLRLYQRASDGTWTTSPKLAQVSSKQDPDTDRRLDFEVLPSGELAIALFTSSDDVSLLRCASDCMTATQWTKETVADWRIEPFGIDVTADDVGETQVSFLNRYKTLELASNQGDATWATQVLVDNALEKAPTAAPDCQGGALRESAGLHRSGKVFAWVSRVDEFFCSDGSGSPPSNRLSEFVARLRTF